MPSRRVSFVVPAGGGDRLVAELWARGTTGVEVVQEGSQERLDAYFDAGAPSRDEAEALAARTEARWVGIEEVPDRDWLAEYRARCEPIEVGPFTIDPREPRDVAEPGPASGLRIPARNAFGTGSHESTRLILEGLARIDLVGRSVLDVGTGSGILAFAALRLGARQVTGFDIDLGSVITARDNGRLNALAPRLVAGGIECLTGSFEVVLVNILPHRWLETAPQVVARLAPQGTLLVSGLLAEEVRAMSDRLAALKLTTVARHEEGEWAALELRPRD